jgi:predicted SAM-dependent methyltransferase
MSDKYQKRVMKMQGFAAYTGSLARLRYTALNAEKLRRQIRAMSLDRLHVGCGNILLKGWLNILYDKRQEYGRVLHKGGNPWLNYNLLKLWPIDDASMSVIAGSHFIEHLDLNEGLHFVTQAARVLKSGGVIRLSCPDLEIYAKNYVERNMTFFKNPLIRQWCAFKAAQTPGQIFIAKAYDSGGSHKWFYDFESLADILGRAGFKEVRRCNRLEGKTPDLEKIEPPQRELETIYVEAVKA